MLVPNQPFPHVFSIPDVFKITDKTKQNVEIILREDLSTKTKTIYQIFIQKTPLLSLIKIFQGSQDCQFYVHDTILPFYAHFPKNITFEMITHLNVVKILNEQPAGWLEFYVDLNKKIQHQGHTGYLVTKSIIKNLTPEEVLNKIKSKLTQLCVEEVRYIAYNLFGLIVVGKGYKEYVDVFQNEYLRCTPVDGNVINLKPGQTYIKLSAREIEFSEKENDDGETTYTLNYLPAHVFKFGTIKPKQVLPPPEYINHKIQIPFEIILEMGHLLSPETLGKFLLTSKPYRLSFNSPLTRKFWIRYFKSKKIYKKIFDKEVYEFGNTFCQFMKKEHTHILKIIKLFAHNAKYQIARTPSGELDISIAK